MVIFVELLGHAEEDAACQKELGSAEYSILRIPFQMYSYHVRSGQPSEGWIMLRKPLIDF